MNRIKKAFLIVVVLFLCVGCDQVTKAIAEEHLPSTRPLSFMGDVFLLQYTTNEGGFLSLGAQLPAQARFWLFTVFVSAVLAGALIFLLFSRDVDDPVNVAGMALTIGGGLGNLIDRLLNDGRVVDFMNVGVGGLRTGVFNVADVALMVGVGGLFAWNLLAKRSSDSADVL